MLIPRGGYISLNNSLLIACSAFKAGGKDLMCMLQMDISVLMRKW